MKIFISWSGNRSRAIAEAMHDWLSRVIQAVEPFYTPNMEKGIKWSSEIDAALEGTRFGIVCLTPDNLHSDWIHYETGALSKTKDAVIWTFLHGLVPSDVPQPLGRFQHTIAEKQEVLKLLHSINQRLREFGTGSLKDALLEEIFEETWSKFEAKLKDAESLALPLETTLQSNLINIRDEKDVLNEILEAVRNQQRQLNELDEKLSITHRTTPLRKVIKEEALIPPFYQSVNLFISKNKKVSGFSDLDLRSSLNEILSKEDRVIITDNVYGFSILVDFYNALQLDEVESLREQFVGVFGNTLSEWQPVLNKVNK